MNIGEYSELIGIPVEITHTASTIRLAQITCAFARQQPRKFIEFSTAYTLSDHTDLSDEQVIEELTHAADWLDERVQNYLASHGYEIVREDDEGHVDTSDFRM